MAVLPPPGPSMAGAFPFMAAMNKSLAQMNKSPNEVRATRGCSALRVQRGEGRISTVDPLWQLPQPKVEAGAFLRSVAFFGQPPKCEVAHTSSRLAPLKSGMATSIWRQEGTHGTETKTKTTYS